MKAEVLQVETKIPAECLILKKGERFLEISYDALNDVYICLNDGRGKRIEFVSFETLFATLAPLVTTEELDPRKKFVVAKIGNVRENGSLFP